MNLKRNVYKKAAINLINKVLYLWLNNTRIRDIHHITSTLSAKLYHTWSNIRILVTWCFFTRYFTNHRRSNSEVINDDLCICDIYYKRDKINLMKRMIRWQRRAIQDIYPDLIRQYLLHFSFFCGNRNSWRLLKVLKLKHNTLIKMCEQYSRLHKGINWFLKGLHACKLNVVFIY